MFQIQTHKLILSFSARRLDLQFSIVCGVAGPQGMVAAEAAAVGMTAAAADTDRDLLQGAAGTGTVLSIPSIPLHGGAVAAAHPHIDWPKQRLSQTEQYLCQAIPLQRPSCNPLVLFFFSPDLY